MLGNNIFQLDGLLVKFVNGRNITKVRLCTRGFEETQLFPTDLPCCSRIGIQLVLAVIASNE